MSKYSKDKRKKRNRTGRSKLEYKKFRVRGNIRSFRDLEVYQQTTEYAAKIAKIDLPSNLKNRQLVSEQLEVMRSLSKKIPVLIAESYGNRFPNPKLAYAKLEKSMELISDVVAGIDYLLAFLEHEQIREDIHKLISKYQKQRRKILNLKKAWLRAGEKKYDKKSS